MISLASGVLFTANDITKLFDTLQKNNERQFKYLAKQLDMKLNHIGVRFLYLILFCSMLYSTFFYKQPDLSAYRDSTAPPVVNPVVVS